MRPYRAAYLYERDGQMVIGPSHRFSGGPEFEGAPVAVLAVGADDDKLGAAVLSALSESERRVERPSDPSRGVIDALGLQSMSQFMRGTRAVDISQPDLIHVTPMRNQGPRRGFDWLTEHEVQLASPSASELGRAARAGLARAKPWGAAPARGGQASAGQAPPAPVADVDPLRRDARRMAEEIAVALRSSGYEADFSLAGLAEVDRFFDEQVKRPGYPRRRGLLATDLGLKLFALGGYLGETIRRAVGGDWDSDGLQAEDEAHLRLRLPDGSTVWPMQRVIKRFEHGREESLAAYGHALAKSVGSPRRAVGRD